MLGGQVTPILSSYFFSLVKMGLHTNNLLSRMLGIRFFVVSEESLLKITLPEPEFRFLCG